MSNKRTLPTKVRKDERFELQMDHTQKSTLFRAAAHEEVPVAQFIRNAALRAARAVLADDSVAA